MKILVAVALIVAGLVTMAQDTATVIVYRTHNKFFGSLARIPVYCDSSHEMVGRAYNGKYLQLTMPTGDHSLEVRESGGGGRAGLDLHLTAGATYYVKVDQGVTVTMFKVSKSEADEAMSKLKLGDEGSCQ